MKTDRRRLRRSTLYALVALCGGLHAAAQAQPAGLHWEGVRIEAAGSSRVYGAALNNLGQVVGDVYYGSGSAQPFVWQSGQMQMLQPFGSGYASATGINDRGQVVGWYIPVGSEVNPDVINNQGFRYDGGSGTYTQVGPLGARYVTPARINERGDILGYTSNPSLDPNAGGRGLGFVQRPDGQVSLIRHGNVGVLPLDMNQHGVSVGYHEGNVGEGYVFDANGTFTTIGGPYSRANAINDLGQIVGQTDADDGNFGQRAWVYNEGSGLTNLGTLGGGSSWALDINNAGQIVGASTVSATGGSHAFLWDNGTMTDLGTLGGESSEAFAINARGHVLGRSQVASGDWHLFFYADGRMSDLTAWLGASFNDLMEVHTHVAFLNDVGQVLTLGSLDTDNITLVSTLITPVPEPEAYALLLAGLLAFVALRRRGPVVAAAA
jgi:probable HAF family extracellular repeat protein